MTKFYLFAFTTLIVTTLQSQTIQFTDPVFKAKLMASNATNGCAFDVTSNPISIDANNDGEIQVSEALNVYNLHIPHSELTDLTGIESFTNLTDLDCSYNSIASLNVNGLVNLQNLYCNNNQLASLNVSNLSLLKRVECHSNQIRALDFTGINGLKYLICFDNQLTTLNLPSTTTLYGISCGNNFLANLNLSNQTALNHIYAEENLLTHIDLTGCPILTTVRLSGNLLETVDLSDSPNLLNIVIENNRLTSIDVSSSRYIASLELSGNLLRTVDISHTSTISSFTLRNNPYLETIFMKNGRRDSPEISNTPNLRYICADELELEILQGFYPAIEINSYCSFDPAGIFYTITGTAIFDEGVDGCQPTDFSMPNLRLEIADIANSGSLFTKSDGNYKISVKSGSHTLTPKFENPMYFNASAATVTFPSADSPFTQNFCITPNGTHPDLEIFINPNTAIPGFDSVYKIIYKNKGNVTQSGTITFGFNAVSDFVSADPTIASQATNQLAWNFTNLKPFETREITVVLNLNAPTATPPLNANDILHFTASIDAAADESPEDNIFAIDQTVFNSFDPNDKTCLEGVTIAPEHIGKYVHYKIRFENTGTFAAKNIVVKDMIDVSKFDISTLIPMSGSHNYTTKIDNTGKVEFIFENINLPFDDANNDGYVIFKIKTKSSLVAGNSFSNQANIYFDYNFPIVTNNATTTIATLAVKDFDFSDYFTLYPNPVGEQLNIQTKENVKISSLSIYDVSGRLIQMISNPEMVYGIDVSHFPTGNYFIKINSEKGTTNAKFAKK